MVGFYKSIFSRRTVIGTAFAGAVAFAPAAMADEWREAVCGADSECPSGSYCGGTSCIALGEVGAACDRDSMCQSSLCFASACGELVIERPIDGVLTNQPKLIVAGRAPAGAAIHIGCDKTSDMVVADAGGKWVWNPRMALPDGAHTIVAVTGSASSHVDFDVDTKGPTVAILAPLPTTIGASGEVQFVGEVEPSARLSIKIDGIDAPATADEHGAWTHLHWLGNGWHEIAASATDDAGNVSVARVQFQIDLEAPVVKIQGPNNGAFYARSPEIISGRAEPRTTLHVTGHGVDAIVDVPDSGEWNVLLPRLADGTYTYLVDVTDEAGWTSSDSVTITIDTVNPGLAMAGDLDQTTITDTRPVFHGTTDPGSEVVLAVDGHRVDSVIAGADSRWSIALFDELAAGVHDFAVTATDRAGNHTRTESFFTVDVSAPLLSIVRERGVLVGDPIVLAGRAEQRASIETRVDGKLVASTMADRKGYWTVSFEADAGTHAVTVTARDISGRTSEGTIEVTVDEPLVAGGCNGAGASTLAAMMGAVLMVLVRLRRAAKQEV
ncbi:MAG: Ig-like domain-containing protein [Myxococcota bacterium]